MDGRSTQRIPIPRQQQRQRPEETSALVRSFSALQRVRELRGAVEGWDGLLATNTANIVDLMHGSAAERIRALRDVDAAERAVAELRIAQVKAGPVYDIIGELAVAESLSNPGMI